MPVPFNRSSIGGRLILKPLAILYGGGNTSNFFYGASGFTASGGGLGGASSPFNVFVSANNNLSSFKVMFSGRHLGLMVSFGASSPIIEVRVDAVLVATVDLYRAGITVAAPVAITIANDLDDTVHEATITVNGRNVGNVNSYYAQIHALVVDESNGEWFSNLVSLTGNTYQQMTVTTNAAFRQVVDETALWNNIAVLAGGTSNAVSFNSFYDEYRVNVIATAPTTITVQYQIGTTWRNGAAAGDSVVLTTGDLAKSFTLRPAGVTAWRLIAKDAATITAGYSGLG